MLRCPFRTLLTAPLGAAAFLVFEPQGIVGLSVTDHILINVGAGYRAVALADALRDRVDGATGSIAVEFDW